MDERWVETLTEEFDWTDAEQGPEAVVTEAEQLGIASLEDLRAALEQAPPSYATGWAKWRYYRELRDSDD